MFIRIQFVLTGVYYSDDKMLQGRIFSYADTQRYRLGANYLMLPANAPKNAHHNNHHEGAMNFMHRDEEVQSYLLLIHFADDAPYSLLLVVNLADEPDREYLDQVYLHVSCIPADSKSCACSCLEEPHPLSIAFVPDPCYNSCLLLLV